MGKMSKSERLWQKQWRKEQSTREQNELKKYNNGDAPVYLYYMFRAERFETILRGYGKG